MLYISQENNLIKNKQALFLNLGPKVEKYTRLILNSSSKIYYALVLIYVCVRVCMCIFITPCIR